MLSGLSGLSGLSAVCGGAAASPLAELLALPGLLAVYLYDEGSGTTLGDSGPNGYHGTLGAGANAPTWTSRGLTFGINSQVTLPDALISLTKCTTSLVTPIPEGCGTGGGGGNVGGSDLTASIVGTSDLFAGWHHFLRANYTARQPCPSIFPDSGTSTCPVYGTPIVTIGFGGGRGRFFVGTVAADYRDLSNNPPLTGGSPLYAGKANFFSGGGEQHLLICWSAVPDTETLAAAVAAITAIKTPAVTRVGVWNDRTTRSLTVDGDSVTFGSGATSSWVQLLAPAQTFNKYNFSFPGRASLDCLDGYARGMAGTYQTYSSFPTRASLAPASVYVYWLGTNSLYPGADAAAVTAELARCVTAVTNAVGAGFTKVLVMPMLSRVGLDTNKTSFNSQVAAYSWPASVTVVPASAMPFLTNDGQYADTTYFQGDQVHPTDVGQQYIADQVVSYVNAAG